jgi:hypothetical protein
MAGLLRVHRLVGEPERVARVVGELGHHHGAAGGRDREARSGLREGVARGGHDRLGGVVVGLEEDAELVAAEPVGATVAADGRGQVGAQPAEQRVARRVPESVVVLLEAIQVEEGEDPLLPGVPGKLALDGLEEVAAVPEPGQLVGERVHAQRGALARVRAQREAEGDGEADGHGKGKPEQSVHVLHIGSSAPGRTVGTTHSRQPNG